MARPNLGLDNFLRELNLKSSSMGPPKFAYFFFFLYNHPPPPPQIKLVSFRTNQILSLTTSVLSVLPFRQSSAPFVLKQNFKQLKLGSRTEPEWAKVLR